MGNKNSYNKGLKLKNPEYKFEDLRKEILYIIRGARLNLSTTLQICDDLTAVIQNNNQYLNVQQQNILKKYSLQHCEEKYVTQIKAQINNETECVHKSKTVLSLNGLENKTKTTHTEENMRTLIANLPSYLYHTEDTVKYITKIYNHTIAIIEYFEEYNDLPQPSNILDVTEAYMIQLYENDYSKYYTNCEIQPTLKHAQIMQQIYIIIFKKDYSDIIITPLEDMYLHPAKRTLYTNLAKPTTVKINKNQ